MKFVALFLIAVALTQAAPTHDDPAWDRTPNPEEIPAHETILADVSYATAKKHVTQMLQAGKAEDACKDLSKATSDEVIASVAAQQKTLDGMPKGEEECDDEGEGLVSKAETGLKEAKDTQQKKQKALADANSQKINFGDFEFDQLQEGQCTSFFNQKVWQDAKAAVTTATTELNTANGAVTAAEKALTDAQDEAAKMVAKCRCSAFALLQKTRTEMNANAKVANTKAWKEAAHMLCVIDGNPEDSCSVPTMPTVKPAEVSDKIKKACWCEVLSLPGGQGFIQMGEWRFGNVDGTHFSFSHKSGKTAVIFRNDGTIHPGPRDDFGLWGLPAGQKATDVVVGNGFVEFAAEWRLGEVDYAHFSLSHKDGKTAMIWRDDGTQHPGPRSDFNTWSKSLSASNVALGDRFIQLGSFWRVGDVDGTHMSIGEANTEKTAVIYRNDGTIHVGPRNDFGLWTRSVWTWDSPQGL